jgi:hypothetical protein
VKCGGFSIAWQPEPRFIGSGSLETLKRPGIEGLGMVPLELELTDGNLPKRREARLAGREPGEGLAESEAPKGGPREAGFPGNARVVDPARGLRPGPQVIPAAARPATGGARACKTARRTSRSSA